MENDITLEALDAIANDSDTADNSVKKIKEGVKNYSDRLNKDREKIKTQIDAEYKSTLSKLLGAEIKNLTQEEIDTILKNKIENSDVVKKANKLIEENNEKLIASELETNLNKIKAVNPTITSIEDLCKHDKYNEIKAKLDKGYDLYDAYISVVGVSLSNNSSIKKSIDSKTISYSQPEVISEATLNFYKRAFPNKTDNEILEMYRRDSK